MTSKTPFDLVLFNMSSYAEWQRGVQNRNFHVLRELRQIASVKSIISVDYPPLTLKRTVRNYRESILPTVAGGNIVYRSLFDKLTRISDRLHVYSHAGFALSPHSFIRGVGRALRRLGVERPVVWSCTPPVVPYVKQLNPRLTVFDAVDNWSEHSSYQQFKERLIDDYAYIRSHADVIFTVSPELQSLFDHGPNVHWIPNGVDLSHYQTPAGLVNRDIADIPHPIVGYIGVVQERVDTDLLCFLAEKNPTKSFVIIGPIWHKVDQDKLKRLSNIHILGYKPYTEAPMYIQQFDAALIPHKKTNFVTSTNPMKLYEYLACGKPVIATSGSGAETLGDMVSIADSYEDFNRKLFLALQDDSSERKAQRIAAVQPYAWSAIVKHMVALVEQRLAQ